MSLTKEGAINFFNYLEKQSSCDNKITRLDLEKAVAVDTNGDGKITDIKQTKDFKDGNGNIIGTSTWTEKEIVEKNVNMWIKNASEKWTNDEAIDINEFLDMLNIQ